MMSRRSGSVVKVVIYVAIGVLGLYGFYLHSDLQSRLQQTEKELSKYRSQHESVSAQLQVVFEHKSRLERSLEQVKADHKKEKEDILAKKFEEERNHNKETQELQNKFESANQQYRLLQGRHEDLQSQFQRQQGEKSKQEEDHRQLTEQHNQEFLQLRQEKDLEISNLKDQIADLQRQKDRIQFALTSSNQQQVNLQNNGQVQQGLQQQQQQPQQQQQQQPVGNQQPAQVVPQQQQGGLQFDSNQANAFFNQPRLGGNDAAIGNVLTQGALQGIGQGQVQGQVINQGQGEGQVQGQVINQGMGQGQVQGQVINQGLGQGQGQMIDQGQGAGHMALGVLGEKKEEEIRGQVLPPKWKQEKDMEEERRLDAEREGEEEQLLTVPVETAPTQQAAFMGRSMVVMMDPQDGDATTPTSTTSTSPVPPEEEEVIDNNLFADRMEQRFGDGVWGEDDGDVERDDNAAEDGGGIFEGGEEEEFENVK